MPRHYEYEPEGGSDPILENEKKFYRDKKDQQQKKQVVDLCPLCVEGGPYRLIYGKDEVGYPVKQCPQCKMMLPVSSLAKISDDELSTSQNKNSGSRPWRGIKLTELIEQQDQNKSKKFKFF